MDSFKYLINNSNNTQHSSFYYNGLLVDNNSVSYDKNNFIVDTKFGPTFESFGTDYVILLDDQVCYFKFFVSHTNKKIFATQFGDFVLTYDEIKNAKRLRKVVIV
jgi:hypothetical protein